MKDKVDVPADLVSLSGATNVSVFLAWVLSVSICDLLVLWILNCIFSRLLYFIPFCF
jgi:hypothetical protein